MFKLTLGDAIVLLNTLWALVNSADDGTFEGFLGSSFKLVRSFLQAVSNKNGRKNNTMIFFMITLFKI